MKLNFFLTRRYKLTIVPGIGVELHDNPILHVVIVFIFILHKHLALFHKCREFICTVALLYPDFFL